MSQSNYYLALVKPNNSVVILPNTKDNKLVLVEHYTEDSKIYRVRGHTVSHAVQVLSEELGRELIQTKLPRKRKYDKDVEELDLEGV